MQISWLLLCCNIVGSVLCRYLGHYFAAQYCRQCTMQIDILVIILLHNTVGSVLCRYLGHYLSARYCRQRTMQISWSLLCRTIMQAAYYVYILVITLLHYIVGRVLCIYLVSSVICRYLGRYFVAQYCRQRSMQISWSLLCRTILYAAYMQISWSLIYCTILQAQYYVDILVITLLHNTVGSVLCRYLGHNFAAQSCRQRTMQICWSLLCCTILQTAYYLDILVVTLLHNTVDRVLC